MDKETRQALINEVFSSESDSDEEFDMAVKMTFYRDFTCFVNPDKIIVTFENQEFLFAHPIVRQYFHIWPTSKKVLLRNMILQVMVQGTYHDARELNVCLEFREPNQYVQFLNSIQAAPISVS
ncbi:hypothetical protein M3Y97_00651600 [Aphelenchoides bicaudatus]|nr:hypothetical protein M3Y97_00651600 [Aphelenchoides bicaudatus]